MLSHEGGPNHLGNLCDAPVLATENHSGAIFQPYFHVLGHFSKFIVPGSHRVASSVTAMFNSPTFGGESGMEGGIGLTMWNCDRSSRQAWKLTSQGHLILNDGSESPLCLAGDNSAIVGSAAYVVDCSYTEGLGVFTIEDKHVVAENGLCLTASITYSADMPAGGAPVTLSPCQTLIHQSWDLDSDTYEIRSQVDSRCVTAGWPFVSSVAAVTPSGETVVVVVNEAKEDVKISLMNEQNKQILKVDIKERSIQTLVY